MRDLLRMPIRILFTSASQRRHTGWTKWLISRMDHVVAVSGRTADYLTVPNSVILHGIDTRRFTPPEDRAEAKRLRNLDPNQNFVGCFGRVRHQKGTDLFVDAMIRLLPQRPGWSAIIAGRATGPHVDFENGLKAKVQAAGLSQSILFVGEHTNINDWYRALDLFVAPQRWEGFGLTPLEAMATGVPVIASDVGAFPELVATGEAGTGEIIARDNLDEMVAATAHYMDDDMLRLAAGRRARLHAEQNFSIEGEASRLGEVYRSLQNSR
jgi:mannosyltransferase